ncbi:Ribonuclease H-like superfamily [Arabidopsis suecica]|uniref:Ribonuclease H-like superfamily n=1 Tax=Arabidopsis suecica TaxID=45249 RepID=A0A8T1ZY18_ARASU|nr:Ribonuclease H-like superfamily [Arabidopsis suecica]
MVTGLSLEGFVKLTRDDQNELSRPFTAQEVEQAVRSMGKYKAPGPDGYQPIFYQQCWDVVGDSVLRFVLEFFRTGELPKGTNEAMVVLIPKVGKPEKITQFRPISLCNVLFKTITKAMVGRLKGVMTRLIGSAQSSFIPGRLSTENIVVVQEAVHSMRRKKGRKGWMLLKLDLEKAYDRIRWDFLEDTLKVAGFSEVWRRWIMQCVADPSMSLLWNGEKTESFKPLRGLRQEASVAQVRVIRRVLEKFCLASGQKVSLEKSKIFFSDNVSRDLGQLISDESGIASTRDLGKYLGMPVLQKRINKDTFGEILERISTRLAGWKGRMLSLAGRITLTKAVISSIPVHSMSTIKLPASTLCKLDKAARDFIWGSSGEGRKLHLVSWKNVCLPKKDGGLGIRTACEMNKALLAKLGWRLLHEKTSLWVRVVSCKYKVGDLQDVAWTKAKSNWSSTWRSVGIGLREVIYKGYGWAIGDGKSVNFWSDRWLLETPIMDTIIEPLPAENAIVKARDLWRNGSGWDWEKIMPYISENRRLELAAVVLDTVTGAKDRLSWAATTNGKFTVKSAYELITRDEYPRQHMDKFYERLWKVIAPERVRVFLWLVGKQVVMTNEERFRRHLCDTEICQICKNGVESIIHVLRDCGGGGEEGESWPTMFAMAVWWGWKWRCGNIFGDNRVWKDRVRFIKELAKEVMAAKVLNGNGVTKAVRVEKMIKWVTPPTGWFKLNTDGASHGNPGLATAGGVLRNEAGEWCGGFALNIGRCSAPLAELWGVYYGLYIAWEQRITRLELEVDSVMVVEFLTTGIGDSHPLSFLVRLCYGFLSKDWLVRISHVYREANRLADGLANYAFSLPLGFHSFSSVPPCLDDLTRDDVFGPPRPRQVILERERVATLGPNLSSSIHKPSLPASSCINTIREKEKQIEGGCEKDRSGKEERKKGRRYLRESEAEKEEKPRGRRGPTPKGRRETDLRGERERREAIMNHRAIEVEI